METIKINDTNEIRISNDEYKGKKFVSIRTWWHSGDGDWKPGKQGITIKADQWEEFQAILMRWEPEF